MQSNDRLNPLVASRRLVVKVGSALLIDAAEQSAAATWLSALAEDIARLRQAGRQVLVVSPGAVALGRRRLKLTSARKLSLAEKQAAAAAGQSLLMQAWEAAFAPHGIVTAQVLLTRDDTEVRPRWLNARSTMETLVRLGAVPVINENDTVATEEIRYGDNDRLAARVAQMIGADVLVLLSDVDGVYSADPRIDPNARHLTTIAVVTEEIEAMAGGANASTGVGTGGMATKLAAARIAHAAGCATIIAGGRPEGGGGPLAALEAGGRCTVVEPRASQVAAYKQWIAGALAPKGTLRVDAGAAQALLTGKSLLPAGVTAADGAFDKGDAVLILGPDGREIAKGLAAYAGVEMRAVVGLRSDALEGVLGYLGPAALVHRDDMVLTHAKASD